MKCHKCNEPLESDWRECPACETTIDKSSHCSNCGKEIKSHWLKCPCCLSRIEKHSKHTVTDIDGNSYKTVKIGSQLWMNKNLNTSYFRNGDPILEAKSDKDWMQAVWSGQPAWCYYENMSGLGVVWGKLYNWYALDDHRGICPDGWKVPSDSDWKVLETYLGMPEIEVNLKNSNLRNVERGRVQNVGGKLKNTCFTWRPPNTGATNESGFSGIPSGSRYDNGFFDGGTFACFWWSSSKFDQNSIWVRTVYYNGNDVMRYHFNQRFGFSVRCIVE